MVRHSRHTLLAFLFTASLAACSVNPRRSLPEVQSLVALQTGQRVEWRSGAPEERLLDRRLEELLQTELTPDDAVAITFLNNPSLQGTLEELGIAEADLVQAGLLKNPVFSLGVQFPGRPHVRVDAGIETEFLDLLLFPLRKKTVAADFERTKATVADTLLRKAAEVRSAYYRLQADSQLVDLAQRFMDSAKAAAAAAEELQKAGNLTPLAASTQHRPVYEAQLELLHAQGQRAQDRAELLALLGMPDRPSIKLPPRLPDLPPSDIDLQTALASALAHRQDLAAARQQFQLAASTLGYTQLTALVNGSTAGIAYTRDPDVQGTLGPEVSIPIPLFDQGQAAVVRAQALLRQSQDRYASLLNEIRADLRKSLDQIGLARESVRYCSQEFVPFNQQLMQQALLQYNAMQISVFDLLQEQRSALSADRMYVEALRDYWVARTHLEYAAAKRFSTSSASTAPASSPPATMPAMPGMNHSH
jgi:cobalt-zinc-cadmium efflux system outer membrane protein